MRAGREGLRASQGTDWRWPAALAALALVAVYAFVADRPTGPPKLFVSGQDFPVEAFLRAHPVPAQAPYRQDELSRSARSSVHLVQVPVQLGGHRHRSHDVLMQMLRGHGVLTVDGAAQVLLPGDLASIPAGAVHSFVSDGPQPALLSLTLSPPFDGKDIESGVPEGAARSVPPGPQKKAEAP